MRAWLIVGLVLLAGCTEPDDSRSDESEGSWNWELDFTDIMLRGLLIGGIIAFVGVVIYLLLRQDNDKRG